MWSPMGKAVLSGVPNNLNYKSRSEIACSVHRKSFCCTATKSEYSPAYTKNTLPVLAFTDDKASLV